MNEKIFNIIAKSIMLIVIIIGVVLSVIVMSYGNPKGYGDKEIYAMGKEVAISEGLDDKLGQADLDAFINKTGTDMKHELMEKQDGNVFNAIIFTRVILFVAALLILVALVVGLVNEPKKYLIGLGGIVVLAILVFVVYKMSSDVLPESLVERNNDMLKDGKPALYDEGGFKLAGGVIWSSIILIVIASITWIGSAVYKTIKS